MVRESIFGRILIAVLAVTAAGCGSLTTREAPTAQAEVSVRPAPPAATSSAPSKGAYYKDDGPGPNPPADLAAIPDAVPRAEPLNRAANRPYQVFGKDYVPLTSVAPFRETGVGSWYGRRYHGGATSSGEKYDMYAMSAAHPTLPIPSYARITNLANGRSVVVRINDRGPFHSDRIIDLSYAAAWKLGYAEVGSARVEVESIVPGASPAPAAAPKPVESANAFLQLGAFSSMEAAENFRVRVYRELPWLTQAIIVVPGGNVYRLHLGPYGSQDEARAVADRIQAEFKLRPVLVVR
jgi:rare lipoprotein A